MRSPPTCAELAPRAAPLGWRWSLACVAALLGLMNTRAAVADPEPLTHATDRAQATLGEAVDLAEHRTTGAPLELSDAARRRWLRAALDSLHRSPPRSAGEAWLRLMPFSDDPMVADALPTLASRMRRSLPPTSLLLRDAARCHRPGTEATEERWRAVVLADEAGHLAASRVELAELLLLSPTPERSRALQALLLFEAALRVEERPAWRSRHDALSRRLAPEPGELEATRARFERLQPNVIGCWLSAARAPEPSPFDALPERRPARRALARYVPFDEAPARAASPRRSYAAFDDEEPAPYALGVTVREAPAQRYQVWDDDDWSAPGAHTRAQREAAPLRPSRYQAFGDDEVVSGEGYQAFGGPAAPSSDAPTGSSEATGYATFDGAPSEGAWLPRDRVTLPRAAWTLSGATPEATTVRFTGSDVRWVLEGSGWWHGQAVSVAGVPGLELRPPEGDGVIFLTELEEGEGASSARVLEHVAEALCEAPTARAVALGGRDVLVVSCGLSASLEALLPAAQGL